MAENVRTIGSTGDDADLDAWETFVTTASNFNGTDWDDGVSGNGGDQAAELQDQAFTKGVGYIIGALSLATATNHVVTVRPVAGTSAGADHQAVGIDPDTLYTPYLSATTNHQYALSIDAATQVEWHFEDFTLTTNGSRRHCLKLPTSPSYDIYVDRCHLRKTTGGGAQITNFGPTNGKNLYIRSCLLRNAENDRNTHSSVGNNLHVLGCTYKDSNGVGGSWAVFRASASTNINVYGCALAAAADADTRRATDVSAAEFKSDYNVSTYGNADWTADFDGTNDLNNKTRAGMFDGATGEVHPKASGDLDGAVTWSVLPSAIQTAWPDTDFFGQTITKSGTLTAGCVQLAAAAGSTTTASLDAALQAQGLLATASLDAAIQQAFNAVASLVGAIQAALTATAALDGAVEAGVTNAASLDAAVQGAKALSASIDAAVARSDGATASLDGAIRSAVTTNAAVDAAIQALRTVTASVDAAIQAGFVVQASLNAAVQATMTTTSSLDAFVSGAGILTASIDAAIQAALTVNVSLDAAIQFRQTVAASIDAAIQQGVMPSADINAAIQAQLTDTTSLDATLQAALSITASADAAIQAARITQASLNAAISIVRSATSSIDALVVLRVLATLSADAAIEAAVTLAVSLDARITAGFTPSLNRTLAARGQDRGASASDARTTIARKQGRGASASDDRTTIARKQGRNITIH